MRINVIIAPVKDLAAAKSLYTTLLGTEPYMDAPYYIGYRAGDTEVGLDPTGHGNGMSGPVAYWEVEDIRSRLAALLAAGAVARQDVTDVGGGKLIATVEDADGNVIGLVQPAG
jgi:predicted enzyme related to lactoylglutathione lyase